MKKEFNKGQRGGWPEENDEALDSSSSVEACLTNCKGGSGSKSSCIDTCLTHYVKEVDDSRHCSRDLNEALSYCRSQLPESSQECEDAVHALKNECEKSYVEEGPPCNQRPQECKECLQSALGDSGYEGCLQSGYTSDTEGNSVWGLGTCCDAFAENLNGCFGESHGNFENMACSLLMQGSREEKAQYIQALQRGRRGMATTESPHPILDFMVSCASETVCRSCLNKLEHSIEQSGDEGKKFPEEEVVKEDKKQQLAGCLTKGISCLNQCSDELCIGNCLKPVQDVVNSTMNSCSMKVTLCGEEACQNCPSGQDTCVYSYYNRCLDSTGCEGDTPPCAKG